MELLAPTSSGNSLSQSINVHQQKYQATLVVLKASFSISDDATNVSLSSGGTPALSADDIVKKLNELLKDKLPKGIERLDPKDTTPDATATHIVDGLGALFTAYQKSNPELQGEELIKRFIDAAKKGVEAGYSDAVGTLKDLGAFNFEGVESSVKETKQLLDDKLKVFEDNLRKQLGLSSDSDTTQSTSDATRDALLSQAGGLINQSSNVLRAVA